MPDEILNFRFQNLHEFVKVARQNLDRNNWDYLIGGSESETTLARNRLALDSLGFRPRVLRDASNVDCTRTLFGRKLRCRCSARRSDHCRISIRAEGPLWPPRPPNSATA
jgi:hypothetical protein